MKKRWLHPIVALGILLAVALGCGLSDTVPSEPETPTSTAQVAATVTPSSTREPANVLEDQVMSVYDTTAPAVVNITNRSYAYDFFLNPVPQEGTGSGFIIDEEGHVVTNYHVIEGAAELLVTLADGESYPAQVVGTDPSNDLAVIRINADDLPAPIPLGESEQLRVGQFVVAIGNPFGLDRTLTVGVISSLGRVIQGPDGRFIGEAIQTDAAINPGNSGGPLLDLDGRLIGVNSQIVSPSHASAGIGFAVPANTVRRVVPELIKEGYYPHPWLGAQMISLTQERAKAFREAGMEVPVDAGLLIVAVVPGGPAEKAGLQGGDRITHFGNVSVPLGGDIITAINGNPVNNVQDLTIYLDTNTRVGDTVVVTVIRDGTPHDIRVSLQERPQQ